MEQTGPKFLQFRNLVYLKENTFKFHVAFWKSGFNTCHNPKGVKLLTRLILGLIHLREQKFKHFSRFI